MLVMATRAPKPTSAASIFDLYMLNHTPEALQSENSSSNESRAVVSVNSSLSFQAQCKSAVTLVKERRIEFVQTKNVRIIGQLNDEVTEKKKKKITELTTTDSVERVINWQYSKKIGPGFANLGNTCYLNSLLQCLAYTPCFAQLLLDKEVYALFLGGALPLNNDKATIKYGNHSRMNGFCGNKNDGDFCSVRAMLRLLQSVHGNEFMRVLQPKELVMNIRHLSTRFRIGRQEDSHEFFRLLLHSMQRSCLRKAHIKNENHQVASTTFVHRIFGGKLKSSLKCAKCGYISERFDDFLDLSLEISNGVNSVKGALQHFTAVEKLDNRNAWKCSSCCKFSCAQKGLTIAECPNVLVIQLKRFDLSFGKIKRHIEFSSSLDIPSGTSKNIRAGRERGSTKYELHAVLVHAGYSTDCGHYYAFVKGSSGQWYEMNDDSVRWVSLDTVLQQRAYMLFYSRVISPSRRPDSKEAKLALQHKKEVETKENYAVCERTSEPVVAKAKELDMNSFRASLTTLVPSQVNSKDDANSLVLSPAKVKTLVTTNVTTEQMASSWTCVALHGMKKSLMPNFGGRVGRPYRFRPSLWKSCPRLAMTQSVEVLSDAKADVKTNHVVTCSASSTGSTRVAFDPQHLEKVDVRNALLFGRAVDTWTGKMDATSFETTSDSDMTSQETVDKELVSKHDRVLNLLKQEEWKHRNAGRQDYWDENLDKGKVKKVKKRKEFVYNEGRKNVFQMTLMRKTQNVKRHRTV